MRALLASLCGIVLTACATTSSPRLAAGDATLLDPAAGIGPKGPAPASLDAAVSLASASVAAPGQEQEWVFRNTPPAPNEPGRERWQPGGGVMQGFLGVSALDTVARSGEDATTVDADDWTLLPLVGGGGQLKLVGERVDIGVEAMMSFAWRLSAAAFASGGGGAVVAVDVDLFLVDLYGGPFVSVFLGDRWRVYGALGPMLQWAGYDQDGDDPYDDQDGWGFGTGWTARTGIELSVKPGLMAGLGVRWLDSTVDLEGTLGDLDLEGLQWVFTVTSGI